MANDYNIGTNEFIPAVKALRDLTGSGLKECKLAIEAAIIVRENNTVGRGMQTPIVNELQLKINMVEELRDKYIIKRNYLVSPNEQLNGKIKALEEVLLILK